MSEANEANTTAPDTDSVVAPSDFFNNNKQNIDSTSRTSFGSGYSEFFNNIAEIQTDSNDGEQNCQNNHIQQTQNPHLTYGYPSEEGVGTESRAYESQRLLSSGPTNQVMEPCLTFNSACAPTFFQQPPDGTEPITLLYSKDMYLHSAGPEVNTVKGSDMQVGYSDDLQSIHSGSDYAWKIFSS